MQLPASGEGDEQKPLRGHGPVCFSETIYLYFGAAMLGFLPLFLRVAPVAQSSPL